MKRRAKAQHIARALMAGARSAAKEAKAKASERAFHVIGYLQAEAELTPAEAQELDTVLLVPPFAVVEAQIKTSCGCDVHSSFGDCGHVYETESSSDTERSR